MLGRDEAEGGLALRLAEALELMAMLLQEELLDGIPVVEEDLVRVDHVLQEDVQDVLEAGALDVQEDGAKLQIFPKKENDFLYAS